MRRAARPWYASASLLATSDARTAILISRFRAWLGARRSQVALGAAVSLFALAVHFVELEPIEIGGDAINKWHFVRQWFHHFDVTKVVWDHHLSRLGVNAPTAVIQLFFGRGAPIYHVASLAASTAAVLLVYVIGVMAHGRLAGFIAAVWLALFPSWVRAGTQLSPDSFGAAWAALALLLLVAYGRAERRALLWLVLSGLAAAWAYLAKEPLVFFIPGALIGVYVQKRRLKDVAIYAAVPLCVFALETLFYRSVSQYSSRFALVSATHGKDPVRTQKYLVVHSVWDALGRFSGLDDYYYPLLVLALLGVVSLPFITKDRRVWAVLAFPTTFFFFYTFAFRHLNPLTLWTRFLARYLDAAIPFAALAAALFITIGGARLLERIKLPPALVVHTTRLAPWAGGLLLVALFGWTLAEHPIVATHPFYETPRLEHILSDAYRRGIPIVTPGGPNGYRVLKAAYYVYIDDDLLLVDGKLPRYADAYASQDRMVRPDAPALPPQCAVRISMHDRFLRLDRKSEFGPECRP
jgi:hypothetical protein